jgi:hypothetical protein
MARPPTDRGPLSGCPTPLRLPLGTKLARLPDLLFGPYPDRTGWVLLGLLAATETWFRDHLARTLAGKSGLEAIELRIKAHLASVDRSDSATAALHAIYTASQSVMPGLKKPVAAFTGRWTAGLVAHMREGQATGEIRKDIDCEAEARFLHAAMRGLMMQYLMDGSHKDLAQAKAILLAHCRDRLGTPKARRIK